MELTLQTPSFDMILPSLLFLGVAAAVPLSAENYDFSVRCEHGPSFTSSSHTGEPDTGCVNVGAVGGCFTSCQALAHDAWQWGAGCKMYVFAERDCGGDYNSVELWTPRPDFEHLAGPSMKLPSEGCVRSYSVHCPFGSVRWPNGVKFKSATALVIQ